MTNGLFNVPSNAKLDHCLCDSPITQFMQLNWGPIDGQESLVLQLENKNKSVSLTLIKVVLPLAAADFPDAKGKCLAYESYAAISWQSTWQFPSFLF